MEESRRELEYMRRMSERTIARHLRLESSSLLLRHELEQKRRGFALMAELAATLGRTADYRSIFVSVGRRLNAALNMQRTVILQPNEKGAFAATVLRGYSPEEGARLKAESLKLPPEFLDPEKSVLTTGADPEERLADLRQRLALPYFISSPVILRNSVAAVLITGRLVEQIPWLTRLGQGDVETVRTVSAYLAAMLAGQRVVDEERRTRLMLDSLPIGCNFLDERGRILDCNQEALNLFGFADKLEYLTQYSGLSPATQPDGSPSRERELELIDQALAGGLARSKWMYNQPGGGEAIPSEVTFVRVGRDDDSCHVLAYIRDLREVRTMLDEIRQTEDILTRAKELAEKNSRARNAFLANIGHELRTPMNGILGMLHLLAESGLTERQREFMDKAAYSARNLLNLLDDIMDFSAMEAGGFKLERAEFSPRETVEGALAPARETARAKNLAFTLEISHETPRRLWGDAARFARILANLADNAAKFTEAGGVTVRLAPAVAAAEGEARLFCEVADTGAGLDEKRLAEFFQPLSQADESTTRRHGGLGMGLAICHRLAAMMGGELRYARAGGGGSVFSFEAVFGLPGGAAAGEAARPAAERAAKGPGNFAALRGLRVLLAEDNEINRMVAVELMARQGVVTDTALNGREALEALAHAAYDLVLMDIQMPEMDGLTAARLIRADANFKALPILALTSHATEEDRERSLAAGMNDHLTKPIRPKALFDALLRWSGRA